MIAAEAGAPASAVVGVDATPAASFSVTVHECIHEIDPAEWNDIVAEGRVWQSHAALALLQDGGLSLPRAISDLSDKGWPDRRSYRCLHHRD